MLSVSLLTGIAVLVLTSLPTWGFAAEVTAKPNGFGGYGILFKGPIIQGDFQRLLSLIKRRGAFPSGIELDSPGGGVYETIEIGRFVRKNLISAHGSMIWGHCVSACAFIYAGSVSRNFSVYGVHRPHFNPHYYSGLNSEQAQKKYDSMIDDVEDYLTEMEVSKSMIDLIMSTPSGNIVNVRGYEFQESNSMNSPAYEEWSNSKCGIKVFGDQESQKKRLECIRDARDNAQERLFKKL